MEHHQLVLIVEPVREVEEQPGLQGRGRPLVCLLLRLLEPAQSHQAAALVREQRLVVRAFLYELLVGVERLAVVAQVEGAVPNPHQPRVVRLLLLRAQRDVAALHPLKRIGTAAPVLPARRLLLVHEHLALELEQRDGTRVVSRLEQPCAQWWRVGNCGALLSRGIGMHAPASSGTFFFSFFLPLKWPPCCRAACMSCGSRAAAACRGPAHRRAHYTLWLAPSPGKRGRQRPRELVAGGGLNAAERVQVEKSK